MNIYYDELSERVNNLYSIIKNINEYESEQKDEHGAISESPLHNILLKSLIIEGAGSIEKLMKTLLWRHFSSKISKQNGVEQIQIILNNYFMDGKGKNVKFEYLTNILKSTLSADEKPKRIIKNYFKDVFKLELDVYSLALDSLVNHRNTVAHGGNINATHNEIIELIKKSLYFIILLECVMKDKF